MGCKGSKYKVFEEKEKKKPIKVCGKVYSMEESLMGPTEDKVKEIIEEKENIPRDKKISTDSLNQYEDASPRYQIPKVIRQGGVPVLPVIPQQSGAKFLRPAEICQNNVSFCKEESKKIYIRQGALDSSWLMSAISFLPRLTTFFNEVVPKSQGNVEDPAKYLFKLWCYGKWVDVTVDDRLPPRLSNRDDVRKTILDSGFWSLLLEKAYAQLHGSYCYGSLQQGQIGDAIVDFTGGLSVNYDIDMSKQSMELLRTISAEKTILSCKIKPVKRKGKEDPWMSLNGLVMNHTYLILGLDSISVDGRNVEFVNLVNCSGDWGTWEGSESLDTLSERKDGSFSIPLEEFVKVFTMIHVCHLDTKTLPATEHMLTENVKDWQISNYEGHWIPWFNSWGYPGFPKFPDNPQFLIKVLKSKSHHEVPVVITVMQNLSNVHQAHLRRKTYKIGFSIYKVEGGKYKRSKYEALKMQFFKENKPLVSQFSRLREISIRKDLEPGYYCIIPYTFYPHVGTKFLLRIGTLRNEGGIEPITRNNFSQTTHDDKSIEAEQLFKKYALTDEDISVGPLVKIVVDLIQNDNRTKDLILKTDEKLLPKVCKGFIKIFRRPSKTIRLEDFQKLYVEIDQWMGVFCNVSKGNKMLCKKKLRGALMYSGYKLSDKFIEILMKKYGDDYEEMNLICFLLCAIELMDIFDKVVKLRLYELIQVGFLQDVYQKMQDSCENLKNRFKSSRGEKDEANYWIGAVEVGAFITDMLDASKVSKAAQSLSSIYQHYQRKFPGEKTEITRVMRVTKKHLANRKSIIKKL